MSRSRQHFPHLHPNLTSPTSPVSTGDMQQVAEAFRVARAGLLWDETEQVKGVYNFSVFDQLLAEFEDANVQPLWLLAFGNPIYTGSRMIGPATPAARQAFAAWAVAAMKHYRGHRIIWELYNEPNIPKNSKPLADVDRVGTWLPQANATLYAALFKTLRAAIDREPELAEEVLVAPALAGLDYDFLQTCFVEGGMLTGVDGITIHFYRPSIPETAMRDYEAVRLFMAKFQTNASQPLPALLSGEWGYSTCTDAAGTPVLCDEGARTGINSERDQAKFLVRQWLVNALSGIPVSIFYDFMNDGLNRTYGEDNFGTVHHQYLNFTVPHQPKLSYLAARVAQNQLGSLPHTQRLMSSPSDSFAVAFSGAGQVRVVVWKINGTLGCPAVPRDPQHCGSDQKTTQAECEQMGCCWTPAAMGSGHRCLLHSVVNTTGQVEISFDSLPSHAGINAPPCFTLSDMLGNMAPHPICADATNHLHLPASDEPQYLIPYSQVISVHG